MDEKKFRSRKEKEKSNLYTHRYSSSTSTQPSAPVGTSTQSSAPAGTSTEKFIINQNISGNKKGPNFVKRSVDNNGVVIPRRFGEGSKPIFSREDIKPNNHKTPQKISPRKRYSSSSSTSPDIYLERTNSVIGKFYESPRLERREKSPTPPTKKRNKKSPEKVPYFADEKRENERLERKRMIDANKRKASTSQQQTRSQNESHRRYRSYSRERHKFCRSKSREKRSRSYDSDRIRSSSRSYRRTRSRSRSRDRYLHSSSRTTSYIPPIYPVVIAPPPPPEYAYGHPNWLPPPMPMVPPRYHYIIRPPYPHFPPIHPMYYGGPPRYGYGPPTRGRFFRPRNTTRGNIRPRNP